jgi:hypothetical protein
MRELRPVVEVARDFNFFANGNNKNENHRLDKYNILSYNYAVMVQQKQIKNLFLKLFFIIMLV